MPEPGRIGSEGQCAPPIKVADATRGLPRRLHRTCRRNNFTPKGAVYVGRPTLWGNPFANRAKIGHRRSIILYRAWIEGDATPLILRRAGLSAAEARSLMRRRRQLLASLPRLAGRDLQCWCPLTSPWCHAEILLRAANARAGQ